MFLPPSKGGGSLQPKNFMKTYEDIMKEITEYFGEMKSDDVPSNQIAKAALCRENKDYPGAIAAANEACLMYVTKDKGNEKTDTYRALLSLNRCLKKEFSDQKQEIVKQTGYKTAVRSLPV